MKKYEYKVVEHNRNEPEKSIWESFEDMSNKWGDDGWELIDFECASPYTIIAIFKREKKEKP